MDVQKLKIKESKGITLIALVITIIVLLILAGVGIATLTGENGILTQAENAKNKTTEVEAFERIQLEVAASFDNTGKYNVDKAIENLKNNVKIPAEDITKNEDGEITVKLNGHEYEFDKDGKLSPQGRDKIIANPTEYYGEKVTNYKSNESDTNTYRIFYVDKENYFGDGKNTIYLKADLSNDYYDLSNYSSYDLENTKVREMNPEWAKTRGESEFVDLNAETKKVAWNINEQASAYLCSPVNEKTYSSTVLPWKEYYNSEYANYVIGGPSVEMYVKSYNQAYKDKIKDDTKYPIEANFQASSNPGYRYTINGARSIISNSYDYTGKESIDNQEYNSMYCGKNKGAWWLASPSAHDSPRVCVMNDEMASLYNNYYNFTNYGCAPS